MATETLCVRAGHWRGIKGGIEQELYYGARSQVTVCQAFIHGFVSLVISPKVISRLESNVLHVTTIFDKWGVCHNYNLRLHA